MPYSDRWGITATKLGANTYSVSHPDAAQPVTVTIDQTYSAETINLAGVLFRAIQALFPSLPPPWGRRYEYAVARWKLVSYQSSASAVSGQSRTALNNKRNIWVAEEARLKAILGSDA